MPQNGPADFRPGPASVLASVCPQHTDTPLSARILRMLPEGSSLLHSALCAHCASSGWRLVSFQFVFWRRVGGMQSQEQPSR